MPTKLAVVFHGQCAAAASLYHLNGWLEHVVRINGLKVAAHSVTHMFIRPALGNRAYKVFSRQYAEHAAAIHNGKVLLPARKDLLHSFCQRVIRLKRANIPVHHLLHRNAAERRAHLYHPRLAACPHPHEKRDEEKEGSKKQSEEAENKKRIPLADMPQLSCVASV